MATKRSLPDLRLGQVVEIDGVLQDESIHEQASQELDRMTMVGFAEFDPLDMKLRLSVIAAASILVDTVTDLLEPWGLSGSSFNVLMTLRHSDSGTLNMSQIASEIVIRPRNLTPLVDQLVERGYVERGPSEVDRRVVEVRITESGAARLDELLPDLFRKLAETSAHLTAERKIACIETLTRLRLGAEGL